MLDKLRQQLDVLLESREALANEIVEAKLHLDGINKKIAALGQPFVSAAFNKAAKVDGTVRFALDSESYKAVIDKRVSWNSDKLQAVAGSIPFEDAQRLFDVEYSMSAKAFDSVTDEKLKARLIEARTVKYGEPKISKVD